MNKRDTIIVTSCVCTALFCIALTFWGNLKNNGMLTTDAFVGFMSALIGVCATIIVGFQIASYLEFRETRKQVEDLEKERKRLELMCSDLNDIRKDLANAFVTIYEPTDNPLMRIVACIMAICVESQSCNSSHRLLARYNALEQALGEIQINEGSQEMLAAFNKKLKDIAYTNNSQIWNDVINSHYRIVAKLDELTKSNV